MSDQRTGTSTTNFTAAEPSLTFLGKLILTLLLQVRDYVDLVGAYDLTVWRPAVELEDRSELVLFGGGLGEHAPGLGSPAG